jgi:hypothetical protein
MYMFPSREIVGQKRTIKAGTGASKADIKSLFSCIEPEHGLDVMAGLIYPKR